MYTNIIVALVVATILTVLVLAYVTATSSSQSYYLCKIAKLSIEDRGSMLYIASSKPAVIHVFLVYSSNEIEHITCYGECQVTKAPLVVAIIPFDVAWHGDLAVVDKVLYLSPCGVTVYPPQCLPWIRLPDAKTSMPIKLPICDCSCELAISGGVLGMCRVK